MEKDYPIKSLYDIICKAVLIIAFYVFICVFISKDNDSWVLLLFMSGLALYLAGYQVIFLYHLLKHIRKQSLCLRLSGHILHCRLPETGEREIDVRQLHLLQYKLTDDGINIPFYDGSGYLILNFAYFKMPILESKQDWARKLLADLEQVQTNFQAA